MTHLVIFLITEIFAFFVSGWDTLSFQSRHSWLLFCETLKDTRDLIHCTGQAFESFSCHSCLFTLCVIIETNNVETPLLSKGIPFSYGSTICVSAEYLNTHSQKGACCVIVFCRKLPFMSNWTSLFNVLFNVTSHGPRFRHLILISWMSVA